MQETNGKEVRVAQQETEFYRGVYQIIGPPGCGKTTFLKRQVETIVQRFAGSYEAAMWNSPVLICSLTRAAAAEIGGRGLPIAKTQVGTLHAHCFRALNAPKIFDAESVAAWNEQNSMRMSSPVNEFTDRDEDLDGGVILANTGDELMREYDLIRHLMEPEEVWSLELKRFVEKYEDFKGANNIVDFTDLIEQTINMDAPAPGNPAVIMVDEAQDLSALEYSLIEKWSEKSAATFVVGDPYQVLYHWRGASDMVLAPGRVPDTHRKILGQSYRVPERVVFAAKRWLENYYLGYYPVEYKPRQVPIGDHELDIRGTVGSHESSLYSAQAILNRIDEVLSVNDGRTVMIQASCAYMVRGLIAEMKEQGIPFSNPWRRANNEWNPLGRSGKGTSMVDRMRAMTKPCRGEGWKWKDILDWVLYMRVKGTMVNGAKKRIEENYAIERSGKRVVEIFDKDGYPIDTDDGEHVDIPDVQSWELRSMFVPEEFAFIEKVMQGEKTTREVVEWWKCRLLAANRAAGNYYTQVVENYGEDAVINQPRVFIGTIHSFKGSEANIVYIFPDLSRMGFAEWSKGEGDSQNSIVRMFYVAMTRAIEEVWVCRNSSNKCAPLRRSVEKYAEEYERSDFGIPI